MQILEPTINTLKHMLAVFLKLATTSYGWAIASACSILTFFATERYAFNAVLAAVLIDAVFGIIVSVRNKRFLLSKLGRMTPFKIAAYMAALVLVFMIERLAHDNGFVGVKVVAAWAIACEFWSMSASILILWPEAVFFKILRRHLRGEISAKLGTDIDDILPDKD